MKLISLYIENFGGLSQYELNLDAGLTTVIQPNGFGKTTLAEFIRAMLYGFPRKTKTLEKSKRQKYAPWNGGQYGGNLIFEHEGERYRIERTFGAVPKGDTFTLIDLSTNRKSSRFSEEIGVELFGLDSDSFERSVYMPQTHEEGTFSTAAIQAKLSDLVEDSGDVGNFDKAIAALKAKRSSLIPYRGNGGTVAEAGNMISQVQMQLDRARLQQAQLEEAQKEATRKGAEVEETQAALESIRQELAAASETAAVAAKQRQYEQLLTQHRQISVRLRQYQEQYPKGMPNEQEMCDAEETADRRAVLTAQNVTTQADLQAQDVLRENARFEAHLPVQQEIDGCRRKCEEYESLQTSIRDLQRRAAELMQTERLHLNAGQDAPQKGIPFCAILLWIIGAVGVISGAVLLVLQKFLYGGIGLGIGAAAVTVGILLTLTQRKKRGAQEETLTLQRKELDKQINAVQQKISTEQQNSDRCCGEIKQYLAAYFDEAEPQYFLACLTRLEHNVQQYTQAQQQVQQWQKRKEQHAAEMAACETALEKIFGRYDLTMEQDVRAQLRRLRDDARDHRTASVQEQELTQQLAAFRAEHGEALSMEVLQAADVQQLKQEELRLRGMLTDLTGSLLRTQQRIQELREQTAQIPQLQEELEHWQSKKAEDRESARILDDTMDFLQRAKDNLSTGYLGTIQSCFGHYLSELEGNSGEKYLVDTDLQVQLERMGQARELAYFSAGQTDLVMLCMRLALVDALFKGQETFVILDDPFVNLDDAHTAQALRLLQALAAERQILYLTCHSSRTF